MTASRSSRAMLFFINGQSRRSAAAFLLFVVVIAIFNNDRAASILAFQSLFVSRENIHRFVQPDDFNRFAHQPERFREIADVLKLGMQRTFRTDAGADDDFRSVTG